VRPTPFEVKRIKEHQASRPIEGRTSPQTVADMLANPATAQVSTRPMHVPVPTPAERAVIGTPMPEHQDTLDSEQIDALYAAVKSGSPTTPVGTADKAGVDHEAEAQMKKYWDDSVERTAHADIHNQIMSRTPAEDAQKEKEQELLMKGLTDPSSPLPEGVKDWSTSALPTDSLRPPEQEQFPVRERTLPDKFRVKGPDGSMYSASGQKIDFSQGSPLMTMAKTLVSDMSFTRQQSLASNPRTMKISGTIMSKSLTRQEQSKNPRAELAWKTSKSGKQFRETAGGERYYKKD